jgi:hypothetical protein
MIIGKARRQLEYEPRKVEKWGSRRKRVDRIVVDNDSSVVVVRWGWAESEAGEETKMDGKIDMTIIETMS